MMWPFYLMALVAIVSTIRVVTNANPVHALLSLIVSLLAVAGILLRVLIFVSIPSENVLYYAKIWSLGKKHCLKFDGKLIVQC